MKKPAKVLLTLVVSGVCLASIVTVATRMTLGAASVSGGADAQSTFNSKCAKCHGRDGRGKTFRGKLAHARDLTDAGWQNDVTDERLFNSISNGRGKMPSFKKSLSESQIDELVGYVRRLRG
ncbi:MAG TPA: c-type cytochrome [Pyrinomonadaceae bacterium]|jgi:mono/diheme cytochrome c family protein|nr:c-type cytochrome [Pyrinomonadaceae bacterium]